jgi:CRISPR/Cas system type I-B associated protein Csh2 (Cas7 group RAMP superfamily)
MPRIIKTFLFIVMLFKLSINSNAQQFTGFKNTDAQKKLEANFDSQLNAKRIGENIKRRG